MREALMSSGLFVARTAASERARPENKNVKQVAMARGKVVLAPEITGIPELVTAGKTGFLYEAGSLDEFVTRLLFIRTLMQAPDDPYPNPCISSAGRQLDWVRHAAQTHILQNFNSSKNLELFANLFLQRVASQAESLPNANFVLQQI